ncbi:MAG TPA: hypothetical protein VNI01_12665 [Elusimicrobiota bacterium]|jgi:poly(3-hydroxybutyrate) depolymerase|nr:hypothetical protein [Elusimicrobiota bacterium]
MKTLLMLATLACWTPRAGAQEVPKPDDPRWNKVFTPAQKATFDAWRQKVIENSRRVTPQQRAAREEERRRLIAQLRPVVDQLMGKRPPASMYALAGKGGERAYSVHVPPGYDGSRKLPLVLDFSSQSGFGLRLEQVRLTGVADRFGFIAAFLPEEADPDAASIRAVLDDVSRRYGVDPSRVYALGRGAGALALYRLAGELSDRIAAVGAVAAPLAQGGVSPRAIALAHVSRRASDPVDEQALDWWLAIDRCRRDSLKTESAPGYSAQLYSPAPASGGAPVALYTLVERPETASQPGYSKQLAEIAADPARTLLWKFFEKQRLGKRL